MKTLLLALVATLTTSMAFAAPHRPGQPDPDHPQPVWPQPPRDHRPSPYPPERPMPVPPDRGSEVVRLGTAHLGAFRGGDTIQVNSCRAGERMRISAIRLMARRSAARIDGLRVTFGNLSSEDISVSGILRAGQSSRWIDIGGWGRRGNCVRSIQVFGRSRSFDPRAAAEVDVFGRSTWRTDAEMQDRREEN